MTHSSCLFAALLGLGLALGGCSSPAEESPSPSSTTTNTASDDPDAAGCTSAPDTDAAAATGPQRTKTPVEQCSGGYFAEVPSNGSLRVLNEFLHSDGTTCLIGTTTELHADGTAIDDDKTGTWKGDVAYFSVTFGASTTNWQPNDPSK